MRLVSWHQGLVSFAKTISYLGLGIRIYDFVIYFLLPCSLTGVKAWSLFLFRERRREFLSCSLILCPVSPKFQILSFFGVGFVRSSNKPHFLAAQLSALALSVLEEVESVTNCIYEVKVRISNRFMTGEQRKYENLLEVFVFTLHATIVL